MKREQFIRSLFFGATGFSIVSNISCLENSVAPINLPMHENNSEAGHLLRTELSPDATVETSEELDILIIGGGISGLSAARTLHNKGIKKLKIIELGLRVGGNSIGGENEHSKYPFGAHYLPIPGNSNSDLISFLHDKKIITNFQGELPVYDELALCHDPEERLLDSNYWFEGLVPIHGLSDYDRKEIKTFFDFTASCKKLKDKKGKFIFDIPISNAAEESEWDVLDKITFKQYLLEKGYTSEKLFWYLDYCCRDDYGQGFDKISAFMGIHYFSARRGLGANCAENAVLTWPEGNQYLVDLLAQDLEHYILNCGVVRDLNLESNYSKVRYTDWRTGKNFSIQAKKVILATPEHVRRKILPAKFRAFHQFTLEHQPWLVATITVKNFIDKNGLSLSWDNVIMNSETLGYIYAQHQSLKLDNQALVFTLYKPLDFDTPKKVREIYFSKSVDEIKKEIVTDWLKIYPNQKEKIIAIDYALWGHGMCSPGINFVRNPNRQKLIEPIEDKVFFAHTDYSGISIFEEAFNQGNRAANEVIKSLQI